MVTVRLFAPRDLDGFDFREEDKAANVLGCNNIEEFIQFCQSCLVYTVKENQKVIAIVGAIEVFKGNFYIWQTPCAEFTDYVKSFTRGLRECTNKFIDENAPNRLYTICKDEKRFFNWMTKGVGFDLETVLEAYGPDGEDMIQFKKVVK